jgi:hypothetical protein
MGNMVHQEEIEAGVDDLDTLDRHEAASMGSSRRPQRVPRSSRPRSGGSSFFLGFLGTLLAGGGVALALSSRFVPALEGFDRQFLALGFDHGSLVFGGLILLALGIVVRKVALVERLQYEADSARADLMLALDQLATDSSQLQTSVLQLHEELATLSDGQKAALDQHRSLAERQVEGAKDGLFRLAASVDKLHARLDERFHQVDLQVRSRFEGLQSALHETRYALEQRLSRPAPEAPRAALPKEEPPRIEFFEALERMEGQRHAPSQDTDGPFPSHAQHQDPLTGLLPSEVRRAMRPDSA